MTIHPFRNSLCHPIFLRECKGTSRMFLSQNFFKVFSWFSISLRRTYQIFETDCKNTTSTICSKVLLRILFTFATHIIQQMHSGINISKNCPFCFSNAGCKDNKWGFPNKSFLENWRIKPESPQSLINMGMKYRDTINETSLRNPLFLSIPCILLVYSSYTACIPPV